MSNPSSFVLSDGDVQDLARVGAVNQYNQTGDVEKLLMEAFFVGTEDMETVDCQGDEEGYCPDELNVDNLAAPGKGLVRVFLMD